MVVEHKGDRIFLVVGRSSLKGAGVVEHIKNLLSSGSIKTILYEGVSPNPTVDLIEKVRNKLIRSGASLVIAVGGGSVLDVGKSVAILTKNKGKLIDFLEKRKILTREGLPLIAIPTTSGTESEVTPWATIWHPIKDKGVEKYSLSSPLMFSKIALLDPELILTLPRRLTAMTGMDDLSHAIEACWSINSSSLSDIHAREAINLIIQNLEKAVANPGEVSYRKK